MSEWPDVKLTPEQRALLELPGEAVGAPQCAACGLAQAYEDAQPECHESQDGEHVFIQHFRWIVPTADRARDRLAQLEAVAIAAQALAEWSEVALATWEGGPMPSEVDGKRALVDLLGALQAAGYET